MPAPASPVPLGQRMRRSRDAMAWKAKDTLDKAFLPPAMERLLLRLKQDSDGQLSGDGAIHRLYVDISVISRSDAGTGIQRVVRSVYSRLEQVCAENVTIIPVVVNRRKEGYRTLHGEPVTGGSDAVFFGLDFATDAVFRYRRELAHFRKSGGRLWFVLHDILPLSHPRWFTPVSGIKYRRWLRVIARLAEGVICVSPPVARQLANVMCSRYGRIPPPRIVEVPLGSSIIETHVANGTVEKSHFPGLPSERLSEAALVVGTLEPRKGHHDVLTAFDLLWSQGSRIPLVLIGRPGWNTEALQQRIRSHPRAGDLLFWYDDVDDGGLYAAYDACRMTIVPSLAEGYGLPLDEALFLGAPVLARDIEVFQRHAGAALAYFAKDAEPLQLAEAITAFHAKAPSLSRASTYLPSWIKTANACLQAIGCARTPV